MPNCVENTPEENFLKWQQLETNESFRFTSGEVRLQEVFASLALKTFHSLKSKNIVEISFSPKPHVASNPVVSTYLLNAMPEHLRKEWNDWRHDYQEMAKRNPTLALYDMFSLLGETNCFESWPTGLEQRIRDWVDSGSLESQPVYDRMKIITPEFYRQLRELRLLCKGWLQWDGTKVQFIPDPS